MALDATVLAPLLAASVGVAPTDAAGQAAHLAYATVLVNYFKANAVVVIAPGSTANGVTTGGASVPVTGTGALT